MNHNNRLLVDDPNSCSHYITRVSIKNMKLLKQKPSKLEGHSYQRQVMTGWHIRTERDLGLQPELRLRGREFSQAPHRNTCSRNGLSHLPQ